MSSYPDLPAEDRLLLDRLHAFEQEVTKVIDLLQGDASPLKNSDGIDTAVHGFKECQREMRDKVERIIKARVEDRASQSNRRS